MFNDATPEEIDRVMQKSWDAFMIYRNMPLQERAHFMKTIALELENCGDALIETAMQETHLPEARLRGERARTIFQLNSYAEACERGDWLEARIDTAIPDKNPPKPDLRKMLVPLGPVVVFGASNFPFAYSTAGGDTACAFAAGCPVVVKAHPAHPQTSAIVAGAIEKAVKSCNMPDGIFAHVYGAGFETGRELVMHPHTRAVGFTGSYAGGKQLFDWGNQRRQPIPVFAEMGSVNPVFLLPEKLKAETAAIAKMYAGSITLGTGQFCTNPGLLIGIESEALENFAALLAEEMNAIVPGKMLHPGISKAYAAKREQALEQKGVTLLSADSGTGSGLKNDCAVPTLSLTSASTFLQNPLLHQEVFGPYSLLIKCSSIQEMNAVAATIEGQLTATLMATSAELAANEILVEHIKNICGRFILNGVPTGVEVCLSMQHGGPFPATSDSRFSSVGADGIKRFARPVAFQNWPDELLPAELQNANPLGIWRTVNNELTKAAVD